MKEEYDFREGRQGAVIPQDGRTRINLYLEDELLAALRERAETSGRGYQGMINDAVRAYLSEPGARVDEETLRRILREELQRIPT